MALSAIPYSGDIRVDSLIGNSWNQLRDLPNQTLKFSFDVPDFSKYSWTPAYSNLQAFSQVYQDVTRKVLTEVALITGVRFIEVAKAADATFHFALSDTMANPISAAEGGPIYANGELAGSVVIKASGVAPGSTAETASYLLWHEFGHVMGLSHPFDYPAHKLPAAQDNTLNSVMSYTYIPNTVMHGFQGYADYDIRALFYIYGGDGYGGDYGYNSTGGPVVLDNIYRGQAGKNIVGSAGIDWMLAGAGNSTLKGGAGSDFMIGSSAYITTSIYDGVRSKYTVTVKAPVAETHKLVVDGTTTGEGVDTLRDVVRLHFSDVNVAYDTGASEHAGQAALLVSAVLGNQAVTREAGVIGVVLSMLDNGSTLLNLSAIVAALPELATMAGGADNQHIASYLLTNATGHTPDAALLGAADQYIKDVGLANMLNLITTHDIHQQHVDLVGLGATGLAYV